MLMLLLMLQLERELARRRGKAGVRSRRCGQKKGVHARAVVGRRVWGVVLGLRGIGAGGDGGGEVRGEFRGKDCGARGGDEVAGMEGGEEGLFETWVGC